MYLELSILNFFSVEAFPVTNLTYLLWYWWVVQTSQHGVTRLVCVVSLDKEIRLLVIEVIEVFVPSVMCK